MGGRVENGTDVAPNDTGTFRAGWKLFCCGGRLWDIIPARGLILLQASEHGWRRTYLLLD